MKDQKILSEIRQLKTRLDKIIEEQESIKQNQFVNDMNCILAGTGSYAFYDTKEDRVRIE
ncbi:MAG: hypothetical protein GY861_07600 [bacterium]|nr:hypothetical protein [bacterium]